MSKASLKDLRLDIKAAVTTYLNALVQDAVDFNEDFTEQDMERAEAEVRVLVASALREFVPTQATR